MARYKLTAKSYIGDRLCEADEEVTLDDNAVPGPHMVPLDAAAKKAVAANPQAVKPVGDILGPLGQKAEAADPSAIISQTVNTTVQALVPALVQAMAQGPQGAAPAPKPDPLS